MRATMLRENFDRGFAAPRQTGAPDTVDFIAIRVADAPYAISWHRNGEIVRCPWHSWEFDIKTGKTLTDPTRTVRTFKTVLKDGRVYVETGAAQ